MLRFMLTLALVPLWAQENHNYYAAIERGGQIYQAQVSFSAKEQLWDFSAEPYTLTVTEEFVRLHDKIDKSEYEMSWAEVEQDFHWLVLFPCLKKSLEKIALDMSVNEQRFDFDEGSWVLHRRSGGDWVGHWISKDPQEDDLVLFLDEK